MKYLAVLLVAVLAASVTSKAILKNEIAQIDPKLFQFAVDFYNQLIAEPINTLASALASMSVHLFAGIATEGISGFGKRDLVQNDRFLGDLWESLSGSVFQGANSLVTNLATSLTQWLVNFALGGNNKGFWSDLGSSLLGGLTDVGNQVAQVTGIFLTQLLLSIGNSRDNKFLGDLWESLSGSVFQGANSLVTNLATSLTQWLVNFALGGNNKGFWSDLGSSLLGGLTDVGNQVAQVTGIFLTQLLLSIGNSRDNKFLGDLWESLSGSVFQGANSLVTNLATSLTQWLVNFALGGNNKGFWSDLGSSLLGGLTDVGNQVAQVTGIFLTQLLLSIGNNNKGLTDLFSNITSTLGGALDNAVQAAAFQIAVWLLNVTENGLLPTIGKRSLTN